MRTFAVAPKDQFRLRLNQLAYSKLIIDKQQLMLMILDAIADLGLLHWFVTNHELALHFGVNTGRKIYLSSPEEAGTIEIRGFVVQFIHQPPEVRTADIHILQLLDVVALLKGGESEALLCFIARYASILGRLKEKEVNLLPTLVLSYTHFTRIIVAKALRLLDRYDLSLVVVESFIAATCRKYQLKFPFLFETDSNGV